MALRAALLLAGLEAASLGWIYWQQGVVYYTAPLAPVAVVAATPAPPAADLVFHPYLGYVQRSGLAGDGWRANNVGFAVAETLLRDQPGCCDYPRQRQDNELLVGIFGGTAASALALRAQADETFARKLREIPAYRDRPIRVLNFAIDGYRQPQAMLTLAYFQSVGQALDVVIAVDGAEEAAASLGNFSSGIEQSFPVEARWGEMGRQLERQRGLTGDAAAEAGLAIYLRHAAQRWAREAQGCFFALCHLGKYAAARAADWQARRLVGSLRQTTATLFPSTSRVRIGAGFDAAGAAADQWRDASMAMAALARRDNALHLHVVQPVEGPAEVAGAFATRAAAMTGADIEMLDLGKEQMPANGERLTLLVAERIAAIHAEGRAPVKAP